MVAVAVPTRQVCINRQHRKKRKKVRLFFSNDTTTTTQRLVSADEETLTLCCIVEVGKVLSAGSKREAGRATLPRSPRFLSAPPLAAHSVFLILFFILTTWYSFDNSLRPFQEKKPSARWSFRTRPPLTKRRWRGSPRQLSLLRKNRS